MKALRYLVTFIIILAISACSGTKNLNQNSRDTTSFSKSEIERIMLSDSTTPMRVYKINSKSDSLLLRIKSSHVVANPKDPILQNFVNRLYRTVIDSTSLGVGIAAPQVGILKNIIWVQRFDKEEFPFEVYLNPIITEYSEKKQTYTEGCLSIPNRSETLYSRSFAIVVEYDTMENIHVSERVEGFTSVIFQHEIDHLNGILYLDYLDKEVKDSN